MNRTVLIISHLDDRADGIIGSCLLEAGCELRRYHHSDSGPLPEIDTISGIVTLGGEESATELDEIPYLADETDLLRAALSEDVPVLGMCLGGQLLAAAAGGRVYAMGHLFCGWPPFEPTPSAVSDPVFAGLRSGLPVLEWHNDAIDPPFGAVVLGHTPGHGSALFRIGELAWGSQPHLEVSHEMLLDGWLADPHDVAKLEAAGYPAAPFRAESEACLPAQIEDCGPAFIAFGRIVRERETSRS